MEHVHGSGGLAYSFVILVLSWHSRVQVWFKLPILGRSRLQIKGYWCNHKVEEQSGKSNKGKPVTLIAKRDALDSLLFLEGDALDTETIRWIRKKKKSLFEVHA